MKAEIMERILEKVPPTKTETKKICEGEFVEDSYWKTEKVWRVAELAYNEGRKSMEKKKK